MKRLHNDNRTETADFVLHESTMRQMRYLTMEARGRLMTMMVDFAANGGKGGTRWQSCTFH